jgi:multidrug resistance protein, MATE family
VALTNIYFMGHLDDPDLLAGVGLGAMLLNVCCFAVSQGLNGALETFVSQSYGAGDERMCGVYLNRARTIVTVILLPVAIAFFFADSILISCGQDPTVSKMARDYVVYCLPGVIAIVQFDCVKRYLQSMLKSEISTYCQVFTTCLHFLWCWLFITQWKWGVAGAAMSLNISYTLCFSLQELYYRVLKRAEFENLIAPYFSAETTAGWCTYLKLGVPSTLMQCFEWWAFELIAIFAGLVGVKDLSAQVAIINVIGLVYMIPLGVQFAASGMVGNMIGAGNVKQAQRYAICCVGLAVGLVANIMIVFNVKPDLVGSVFTKDQVVIDKVTETIPMLSAYLMFDAVHGAQSGNVRALGRQFAASMFTLICYYSFGLPMALIFGFKMEMGVKGFWLGFLLALICLDLCVGYLVIWADWSPKIVNTVDESKEARDDDAEKSPLAVKETQGSPRV